MNRTVIALGACFASFLLIGASATRMTTFKLMTSQIDDEPISNDIWQSGLVAVPGMAVTLNSGEMLTMTWEFEDGEHLEICDNFFADDESIHLDVIGNTAGGGARTFDYEITFLTTGGSGTLTNPVTGSGEFGNLGDLDIDQFTEYLDGDAYFHGIQVKITNTSPVANWNIGQIGIGVDAEEIEIGSWPSVPGLSLRALFILLSSLVVGGAVASSRRS